MPTRPKPPVGSPDGVTVGDDFDDDIDGVDDVDDVDDFDDDVVALVTDDEDLSDNIEDEEETNLADEYLEPVEEVSFDDATDAEEIEEGALEQDDAEFAEEGDGEPVEGESLEDEPAAAALALAADDMRAEPASPTAAETAPVSEDGAPPQADISFDAPTAGAVEAGVLPDEQSIVALSEIPKAAPRAKATPEISRRKLPIGQMLLEAGHIKEDQLEMALAEQRRTKSLLGEVLVSLGFVVEEVVARMVSTQTGIPFVTVPPDALPVALLKLVPEDVARKYRVVGLGVEGAVLKLAMANPFDVVALDSIRASTGLVPFPSIATWGQINKCIERNFATNESFDEQFERLIASAEARVGNEGDSEDVTRGPLVELVDQIIIRAAEERATDIHIEPEELVIRIRYRIDSILQPGPMIPKKLQNGITARLKVMAGLNIAENRVPQDGRIRFAVKGRQIDLRMSTMLCNYGENIVLRVLDKSSVVLSLEKVGFLKDDMLKFEKLIDRPHGIILVTGPTGSGKTTTLYAALSKLNTIDVNIMTIEDPIEYELNLIRQSQINVKAGVTFASGLRALLRQDPDIILIGEMRDQETAQMAIRAAMTGHMVFSTLHTNTAAGAVNRVVDMGVEPLMVTDTVIAAIGQRLSRMTCPKCKQPIDAPRERWKELEGAAEREKIEWDGKVVVPKGCLDCRFKGYHGRAALFEIFEMTREAQDMILKRQFGPELMRLARAQGMRTMYDDGLRRVLLKTHTLDELDRVIEHDLKVEIGVVDA
jgi:type IV pilus assembly protein PilB